MATFKCARPFFVKKQVLALHFGCVQVGSFSPSEFAGSTRKQNLPMSQSSCEWRTKHHQNQDQTLPRMMAIDWRLSDCIMFSYNHADSDSRGLVRELKLSLRNPHSLFFCCDPPRRSECRRRLIASRKASMFSGATTQSEKEQSLRLLD